MRNISGSSTKPHETPLNMETDKSTCCQANLWTGQFAEWIIRWLLNSLSVILKNHIYSNYT